ncbi:uncharacterized protein B0H18DRAFT_1004414 [Fomitopsis serialis]|uniref:uncharacterized protein n=1 Tax=Fomitopsis serialis TaxID=139415 RepID=UPI0020076F3E|nr:uncharacterized protein B0H18DRAFT_1004414 [Neoantrodia serialis]KAH9926906.1 hypothetical protein B0H18DRAFT_1004414 [Neoantrodia serialis]
MGSDNNPFRYRAASSNATGGSQSSGGSTRSAPESERGRRSPSPDLPPEDPERTVLPPLPPRDRDSSSGHHILPDDLIGEELPPAYTPAPDTLHGESTIELGPRRPFQQPQNVPRDYLSPNSADRQRGHRPSASTNDRGQYPGHGGAIPRHPSLTRDRPRTAPDNAGIIASGPLSDFAREFYAAGGANVVQTAAGGDDGDDGRPTATPKPGHPLMRNGRVLVYPAFYECRRCHNAGYRNNDPTTPCYKCWEKYARPFSGPLTSMDWKTASVPSGARLTYQRPLPRFTPPHLAGTSSPPSRATSQSRPPGGYSGGSSSRMIPVAGGRPPPTVRLADNPPPGATVMRPGDPRLGGRLCWRCGGSGITTF